MPSVPLKSYLDRVRAGSFGSVAEQYDRYRLVYPGDLIDDLAGLSPTNVLDVGCGTGQVAVALAERGLRVLGVELDERMAHVARNHGTEVEVAAFEEWDARGRTFDLVTCGGAWHWIHPENGVAKAAEVLNVSGTIARFWTSTVLSESARTAFEPVYRDHAPEVTQFWRPQNASRIDPSRADLFEKSSAFSPVELNSYQWESSFDDEEWAGLVATVSDHLRLGPERLTALLQALRATIDNLGGTVHAHHETHVLLAQRV